MYFYNDGMKLCDGCVRDSDMFYGDYVPLKEWGNDDVFCDFCGKNDWVDGEDK